MIRRASSCVLVVLSLAAISALPTAASAAPYTPVAAYSFDEGEAAGTTLEDQAGENDGTLEGVERTPKGRYGGALSFHGTEGECASVPNSESLQLKEEFTIEAWVKSDSLVSEPIVYKETEGYWSYWFGIALGEEGRPEANIADEGGEEWNVRSPYSIEAGVWTHLAVTYDGAHMRLYVDGEEVATKSVPGAMLASEGPLYIGCAPPNTETFDGRIDELRIYQRALDGAEVAADMEAPIETPKAGPVAEYSFDEDAGTVLHDLTGDGNDGTIEGAEWAPGKYGTALEFDAAEGDVVTIPDSESLRLSEEFTLEAWVRPDEGRPQSPVLGKAAAGQYGYGLWANGDEGSNLHPMGFISHDQFVNSHAYSGTNLPTNAWSHLAVTDDGAHIRLYVDGKLADERESEEVDTGTGPLQIGGDEPVAEGGLFDGRIDEVRIYDRGLDGAEVATDMEAPIQTPRRGPIAAWSFEEGEGSTVEDVTGDGHDGTIEGAEWARGKYGKGLKFDGESDVVKVPNSPEFALTEGFTLEAWVRPESESNQWAPILAKEMGGGEATNELAWWLYEGDWNTNEPFGGTEPMPGNRDQAHAGDPLPVDVWSHVALTYDGAQVRLYVDGELVDCSSVPAGSPPVTGGELQIGAATEHGDYFQGRIDEARVYNRALTKAEVAASMSALPHAQTDEPYGVDETEVVMSGTVNPMGSETAVTYEYGLTADYGTTYPSSPEEIEEWIGGDQPQEVEQGLEELEPGTTYHYRVVATNSLGRVVGPDRTFTTPPAELQPNIAAPDYSGLVGVNWSGSGDTFSSNTRMKYVSDSGAKIFRVVVYPPFGTAKERKVRRELNDNLFEFMTEHQVKLLPDVSGIPGLNTENRLPPIDPGTEARENWIAGLKSLVMRYGHGGGFWEEHPSLNEAYAPVFWEIWNEENEERNADYQFRSESNKRKGKTGEIDPARYGTLLEISHTAIGEVNKAQSADMKVMFGGLLSGPRSVGTPAENGNGPPSHYTVGKFIRETHHSDDYDALSLHPYAFKGSVNAIMTKVKANIHQARVALNERAGRQTKIWVTEIGWAVNENGAKEDKVHTLVNESTQRARLEAVIPMIKSVSGNGPGEYNIGNIFWYNIQDWLKGNPHPDEWAAHCGLVKENGQKRGAFEAFQKQAE